MRMSVSLCLSTLQAVSKKRSLRWKEKELPALYFFFFFLFGLRMCSHGDSQSMHCDTWAHQMRTEVGTFRGACGVGVVISFFPLSFISHLYLSSPSLSLSLAIH